MVIAMVAHRKIRVACYVDGFNLYHAIDRLGENYLKWVDLRSLLETFIQPSTHEIVAVNYYSAFANHRPSVIRHRAYVEALKQRGVMPCMSEFLRKTDRCHGCGRQWYRHEEKQSDVNIAIGLIEGAFKQHYDEAFLVSRDSDFAPALRAVKHLPLPRRLKVIAPPGLGHSKELVRIAGRRATIQRIHIERNLLPEVITDAFGNVVATRPPEYEPPSN